MPMPPVSMISQQRPPYSTTVPTRSRVTPAVGSTMLIRRPASQLNSDDLPTFGRPTMATTGSGIRFGPSPERVPAVHDDGRPGYVTASVARQEDGDGAEFVRPAEPAHRRVV